MGSILSKPRSRKKNQNYQTVHQHDELKSFQEIIKCIDDVESKNQSKHQNESHQTTKKNDNMNVCYFCFPFVPEYAPLIKISFLCKCSE